MQFLTQLLYGPPLLSWATTLIGTGVFAGVLIILARLTRRFRGPYRWAVRGAGFGALVLPLAVWLYGQFFTDPLRALVLGFPGLLLLRHFAPLQDAGVVSHAIVENTAAGASSALRLVVRGGVVWASIYGALGFLLGAAIERRARSRL
jgi:hypothetical protein